RARQPKQRAEAGEHVEPDVGELPVRRVTSAEAHYWQMVRICANVAREVGNVPPALRRGSQPRQSAAYASRAWERGRYDQDFLEGLLLWLHVKWCLFGAAPHLHALTSA